MHCTVCTVRVSSSGAAPVQVVRRKCNKTQNAPFSLCFRAMFPRASHQPFPQTPIMNKSQSDISCVVTFVLLLVVIVPAPKCFCPPWVRRLRQARASKPSALVEQVVANPSKSCLSSDRVLCKAWHLSLFSAGLGSAATASAEAGLQAVDEVADDGEDEQEDDDNDRDDDVAGHFGG